MADDQTDLPPMGVGLQEHTSSADGNGAATAVGDTAPRPTVGPALSYDSDDLLTTRRGFFATPARTVEPAAADSTVDDVATDAPVEASANGHQEVVFSGPELAAAPVAEPMTDAVENDSPGTPSFDNAPDLVTSAGAPSLYEPVSEAIEDGPVATEAESVPSSDWGSPTVSAFEAAPDGSAALAAPINGHVVETVEFAPTVEGAVATLPVAEAEAAGVMAPPPAEPPAPPSDASLPPAAPPPPPGEEEEDGATMTIIEHLEELRRRLFISAVSVVLGAVVGWFFVPWVLDYVQGYAKGVTFVSLTVLGPLALKIKLAFLIGLILGSPMVLYQIWAFVAPGLTRRERRYALPFSFLGSGLFAAGAISGVLIVPLAIRFLLIFFPQLNLGEFIDINGYVMFIALIAVIFGITFELPIFMVGFSLLGVVNSRFFVEKFKLAIFIMYGAAMVITPGVDFISPIILGTVLTGLYWVGIFLIRWIGR